MAAGTPRVHARWLRELVTAMVSPGSAYHHDATLLEPVQALLGALTAAQHADGTFSIGNLHSPPDTAFVIDELAVVCALLRRDIWLASAELADGVERIVARCGPPLVAGGVHTPNHRWGLCAALAHIDQVAPDPAYRERIEQWLAEGIDQDVDGCYSERSPNYAARVTNPSLLTLAWLLGLPELRAHVRRSLEFALFCLDSDGEIESIQSRRQDQDRRMVRLEDYYLQFRELAVLDGDARFVAATRAIELGHPPASALGSLLQRPELAAELPDVRDPHEQTASGAATMDTAPDHLPTLAQFTTVFRGCGLARLRRGISTASIYGGTDEYPQRVDGPGSGARVIGSGLATNPTFLRVSHGAAVLDSVRLATSFFGTGHFRARDLERLDETAFRLRDEVRAAYYHPLPPASRQPDGDYALEYDGRFFSKLSFSARERDELALRREVVVREVADADAALALDIEFAVDGVPEVPVTVELCFAAGGELSGPVPEGAADAGVLVLAGGTGRYRAGPEEIEFGPGCGSGVVDPDPGEQYRAHGGGRTPSGTRVYLTGVSPFHHRLRLRCTSRQPA